jgi:hypothetical protein
MKWIPPYVWLGPSWYAWLEFGSDNRHATFLAIGERVAAELGGKFQEHMPDDGDVGKEYAYIVVAGSSMMLMRKDGFGVALGAERRELPLLLRVAALYGAEFRGWRWPIYRIWQRLFGGRIN